MPAEITNADGSRIPDQTIALAELLTDKSVMASCYGRAIAAHPSQPLEQWIDAEFERGTDPATIIAVAMKVSVDMIASVVGSLIPTAEGRQAALKGYTLSVENGFLDIAGRAARAMSEWSASTD